VRLHSAPPWSRSRTQGPRPVSECDVTGGSDPPATLTDGAVSPLGSIDELVRGFHALGVYPAPVFAGSRVSARAVLPGEREERRRRKV
jgi:hypothetical protein